MINVKQRSDQRKKQIETNHKIAVVLEKIVESKQYKEATEPSWWSKLWR